MAQEKILGNQLNLTDVANELTALGFGEFTLDASANLVSSTSGGSLQAGATDNFLALSAGNSITTADRCVAIGTDALATHTIYADCVAIGWHALTLSNAANNVGIGTNAGGNLPVGSGSNVFVGASAGSGLNIGGCNNNVAIGTLAIGNIAGTSGGSSNTAVGGRTLYSIDGGINNIGVGYGAGEFNTSGDRNVFLGHDSGHSVVTGSRNVMLGAYAGPTATDVSNQLFINNAESDTPLIHGTFATAVGSPLVDATITFNATSILGGNLSVNGYKIGNSPVGSPHTPTAYLEFTGEVVNLFSGATASTTWDSSVAILSSTDGTTGETAVQTVTVQGQNRFGTTGPYGTGGDVVIAGGDTTGSPNTLNGGDATLRAGSGFNNTGSFVTVSGNGSITLQQAAPTAGSAGSISLIGANGGTSSGAGADIVLYAGNGTDTNGAGGDITLRPGRGVGIGADGLVAINNPSGSTTEQSKLRFFEAATNGSNYVELVAQANIGTSVTWTLPADQNTVGDPLGIDLGEYTVGTLPTASTYPNCWALVTDAAGGSPLVGRVTVRSDGTNWKMIAAEGPTAV